MSFDQSHWRYRRRLSVQLPQLLYTWHMHVYHSEHARLIYSCANHLKGVLKEDMQYYNTALPQAAFTKV